MTLALRSSVPFHDELNRAGRDVVEVSKSYYSYILCLVKLPVVKSRWSWRETSVDSLSGQYLSIFSFYGCSFR